MDQTDSPDGASAPSRHPDGAATTPPQPRPPEGLPEPDFGFAPPDRYDPAEYRWVPVRRVPRRDGWTEEKQRRFIEVLADTGLVAMAAREVGMSRQAAYKLRRAPHAAAFARAWDMARERAGALIEDIAFTRAIEGVEQEIYDANGMLTATRVVQSDRLLTYLLSHLKPERYGRTVAERAAPPPRNSRRHSGPPPAHAPAHAPAPTPAIESGQPDAPPAPPAEPEHPASMDEALRAMEPDLPAPMEDLLDPEDLEDALLTAEVADGELPRFHAEQRPRPSPEEARRAALAAHYLNGEKAAEKAARGEELTHEEQRDEYLYLDPSQENERLRKARPPRPRRDERFGCVEV